MEMKTLSEEEYCDINETTQLMKEERKWNKMAKNKKSNYIYN